jgi:Holliday junction resolvase RusA-like endonuclease
MRAFLPRGRTVPIVTHDNNPALRSWRDAVASEALRAMRSADYHAPLTGALSLELWFYLPKPKSRPHTLRTERQLAEWAWPTRRQDADKLARAALDAMTGIVFLDDAQIVNLEIWKVYDDAPGLNVKVGRLHIERTETEEAKT